VPERERDMIERAYRREERVCGRRFRFGATTPLILALVGVGILAAACGGRSTGIGVASLGSTASSTTLPTVSQGGIGSANYTDAVRYAQCMRSHGLVNFPDPNSEGNFLLGRSTGVNPGSAQFNSADKACRHLLPNGGESTPAEQQEMLAAALKYVACMRAHGLPTFPDPIVHGGNIGLRVPAGVRPGSPQFQAAQKACVPLLPGGGP